MSSTLFNFVYTLTGYWLHKHLIRYYSVCDFQDRIKLTVKSVYWLNTNNLPFLNGSYPINRSLKLNKRVSHLKLLLPVNELWHWVFPHLQITPKHQLCLGFKFACIWIRINYTIDFPGLQQAKFISTDLSASFRMWSNSSQ